MKKVLYYNIGFLFILLLILVAWSAHADDIVSFTDSGFQVNGAVQSALFDAPTFTGRGTSNSVWNNNIDEHDGNTVNINYTSPPAGFSDPSFVFGGAHNTDDVVRNTVNIGGNATITSVYGGYSQQGEANQNNVIISNGTVDTVYGAYSYSGGTAQNAVTINGGTLRTVYGGYSYNGISGNNAVTINDGTLTSVYGAYSVSGSVSGNSVNMHGGTVNGSVYGGATYNDGEVRGNILNIDGGTIAGYVYGGNSRYGNVIENQVTIANSTINAPIIYGGFRRFEGGEVKGNSVTITNSSVNAAIFGGDSVVSGSVAENKVIIEEGSIFTGTIVGGHNNDGVVSANSVTINNAEVTGTVYGGSSENGDLNQNQVIINNSTVGGYNIYGGFKRQADGQVVGNSVHVTESIVSAGIYGGENTGSGQAASNNVTINGGTIQSTIFGGHSNQGDVIQNSVNIDAATIEGYVYAGSGNGNITGNILSINDSNVTTSILYGGFNRQGAGDVAANSVTLQNTSHQGDIYGGSSPGGGNVLNNSVSTGNSTIEGHIFGGQGTDSVLLSGNKVTTNNTTVSGVIYGGYNTGSSLNNQVIMNGGQTAVVIGGVSVNGQASENSVTVNSGTVENVVAGGRSDQGEVRANSVNINGANITGDVFGGDGVNGLASENQVAIENGTIQNSVWGGHSGQGDARANSVTIDGASIAGNVFGGESASGLASENHVAINNGAVDSIWGGRSGQGEARANSVTIDGASIAGNVFGGESASGMASENSVTMNSGTATGAIYGGYSSEIGSSINNQVIMNGGQVRGIMGGASNNGDARENTVTINSGAVVVAYLYGGYSNAGNATYNTVTINEGSVLGSKLHLAGGIGCDPSQDYFTGNTLNLLTMISVGQAGNFENYNFYLPPTIKNEDAMLTITGFSNPLYNEPTNIDNTNMSVYLSAQAPELHTGDVIHLIKVDTPDNGLEGTPKSLSVTQGLTLLYRLESRQTDNTYDLLILGSTINPQSKAFSEGRAASLAFVMQGENLAASQGIRAASQALELEHKEAWTVFGIANGGVSTYKTGSSADVRGMSIVTGVVKNNSFSAGNLLAGAFVEGGFGSYDSHNNFSNAAAVTGNGDVRYIGGGVLGRFNFHNGWYSEGSLRMGRMESDFSSANINDQYAHYDSSAMYLGAHLGAGYVFKLTDSSLLDVYGKYLFSRLGSDSIQLNSGEDVEFDAATSHRGRIGTRYSYLLPQADLFIGAAYDYEFDGDIGATVRGRAIDEPSLQGGTGIVEAGFRWRPTESGQWYFDFGVEGYVGVREGMSGTFTVNYEF